MSKINFIILIGPPGSGKSTWAEKASKDKGTFVISMDDIRMSLKKTFNPRDGDGLIYNMMLSQIRTFFSYGPVDTVIIDNTNLVKSQLDKLVEFINQLSKETERPVSFELKLFKCSWVELVKRNQNRGAKAVPMPVLRSMYINFLIYCEKHKKYQPNEQLPKAIIVDIDGTIANNKHRSPYDLSKLADDKTKDEITHLVKMYKKDNHKIILVSGRHQGTADDNSVYRRATADWLAKNKIQYDALYMRQWDDNRKDDEVKENIFWNCIAPDYNVKMAIDDRDRVVEMWRRIGVPCLQVDFGEF